MKRISLMQFIIGFIFISVVSLVYSQDSKDEKDKAFCKEMRRKYDIVPGDSFGTLPQRMHEKYLSANCYRFFCQPNPMSGKGKFKCEYLPGVLDEFDKLKLIPN